MDCHLDLALLWSMKLGLQNASIGLTEPDKGFIYAIVPWQLHVLVITDHMKYTM